MSKKLEDCVTTIPDFPKPGIMFRDITTIISDPEGFKMAVDQLCDMVKGMDIDIVVGSESRGFIFGAPVAYALGKGFVMARKKGKLPRETISETYDLEYGTASVEIETDAVQAGKRVLIVDDLIATGGTAKAATDLIEKAGGTVAGFSFVMRLDGLDGLDKLDGKPSSSLIAMPA